jgi:hypothetical protein
MIELPTNSPAQAARILAVAVILLSAALVSCGLNHPGNREDEMTGRTIEEVLEAHTAEWMTIPGVVGTGIGLCEEEPCIRIFLSRASPEAEESIPERIEGFRVERVVTGEFRPRSDSIRDPGA